MLGGNLRMYLVYGWEKDDDEEDDEDEEEK